MWQWHQPCSCRAWAEREREEKKLEPVENPRASTAEGIWIAIQRPVSVPCRRTIGETDHTNNKEGDECCFEAASTRWRSAMCHDVSRRIHHQWSSDDVRDPEPPTQNYLLLFRQSNTLHPDVFQGIPMVVEGGWRQVQYLADLLWRRTRGNAT